MSILIVFRFFADNGYAYTRFNPLEAKKQLNSLHVRKTDKIDTEKKSNKIWQKILWELRIVCISFSKSPFVLL